MGLRYPLSQDVCCAKWSILLPLTNRATQYAAKSGYDCIWLDLEHRAMGQREVQALLQLGVTHDIDIMVRSPSTERTQLYRWRLAPMPSASEGHYTRSPQPQPFALSCLRNPQVDVSSCGPSDTTVVVGLI